MAEINSLNNTDASNTTRWNGPDNVSTLDNAGQALEGMLARNYKDTNGSNATLGSEPAYTIQLNRTGIVAHADIGEFSARFHAANSGAATITVNSLSPKPIRKKGNAALVLGDITTNEICDLVWNAAWDAFQLKGLG